MTTQPEALRLAEELDDGYPLTGDAISAAAELRTQHARITELEAQLSAIGAGGVSPLIAGAAGWRSIATAPKDGTEILLGRAESEDMDSPAISTPGYWQEGYEDGADYMGCDSGFVDSHHQVFDGGRSFGAESHRYAPNQPTHWQPLPAAPHIAGETK